jgi:HlyD family secretion protein
MDPKTVTTLRRVGVALAVIVAIALAVFWFTRPKPVPVVVTEVQRGTVESSIANTRAGTIESCQRTKLSTIIGGRIEILAVKEGDRVKKGQLLMQIWHDDIKAQERLAQAALETSRRRVVEACTLADSAEREVKRQVELHKQGFISANAIDVSRAAADARAASCATAKADVAQAEAKLKATRVEQGRVALYAPFDGTVAKIVGELGEYSTPSPPGVPTPPAIDLIDDSCLYVKAPMDEVDAPKIGVGQPVRVTLDALPGKIIPGKVRRVAPYVSAVEKQARTVDVEVDFVQPEATGKLLVGYSADVEIVLDGRDKVLRIPTAAIQEGGKVLLFDAASGKLEERKVKAGLANWEYTEILDGLVAGDRIVTSLEKEGVKAGARVTPDDKAKAR